MAERTIIRSREASRRRVARVALFVACLSSGGCYRSHERGEEAGLPTSDAGVVHPIDDHCPDGYLRVKDTLIFSRDGRQLTNGSLEVVGQSGVLFDNAGALPDGNHGYDLCFPRSEAPLDLAFSEAPGGEIIILDLDDDFLGETWGHGPPNPPDDVVDGRLVRQQPESVFEVNFGPDLRRTVRDTPFEEPCEGIYTLCRARFIEIGADGALLGGGEASGPGELVLDASGSIVSATPFEVELPAEGMLADLPLEIRALDCSGNTGDHSPGQLDDWRCTFSGVGRVESQDGRVVRGTLQYLEGPVLHTGFVTAHLGSEAAGLEAYVFAPCCSEPPDRLSFPEVRTLEANAPGGTLRNFHYTVDAPGYEHAFVFVWPAGAPMEWYDFHADGAAQTVPLFPFETREFPGVPQLVDRAISELWVGAITTTERDPWAEGMPVAMVRRRIIP